MLPDKYNISLISNGLRREETVNQYADALAHLEKVSEDIFIRVSNRVKENRSYLEQLQQRIAVAEAKIVKVKGSNKATQVFSSSKYPASVELQPYVTVFQDIEDSLLQVTKKYRKIKTQMKTFSETDILEKKQFYQVPQARTRSKIDDAEGLGGMPKNCKSISSLLLFNTSENPYKKYSFFDPLGVTSKTRSDIQEEKEEGLADAPASIVNREQMERHLAESYLYIPDLGDVPEIDVPMDLPDLPGVADLSFSSDLKEGIAPSLVNMGNLPDLLGLSSTPETLDVNPPTPAPPPEAPPPPPPPPMNPPPTTVAPLADNPPPPPPLNVPPPPPLTAPKEAPATAQSGDRSSLMESIRAAGGAGKVKLKSAKERKLQKKKEKEEAKAAASSGGDLMSDLFNKLSMRRKGISGAKKAGSSEPSTMDKISAMIPPPPTHSQPPDHEDDDWN